MDLSDFRRACVSVQSDHRRQRDVRAREGKLARRDRCHDAQGALDSREPARHHKSRHQLLGERGREGSPASLLARRHAASDRCAHRQIHSFVRRKRRRQFARGIGPRSEDDSPGQLIDARAHFRGSADPRQLAWRGLLLRARPHPRVQRRHGQARLDVPHDSATGRVRLRHLAGGCVAVRRRRQRLGRDQPGRKTRHCLFPGELADLRLLRRGSSWRQSLQRLPARARCAHGQAALALPDGASRLVGLRSDRRAAAHHRAQRRQDDRRRRAGHEARFHVRVRSRHGGTCLADRRAAGAEERRAGRASVADAALLHARAYGAPGRRAGRSHTLSDQRCRTRRVARAHRESAHGTFHAARARRSGDRTGRGRRNELGQHRRGSRQRNRLSTQSGLPVVLQIDSARRSS